jgi:DNA-binding SARP family transcriptional activator
LLLRTFGALKIEAEPHEGDLPSPGPRPLALLAVIAAAGSRGISRERIVGILWAETDEEQARHTLSQTRYLLRRTTQREWISGSSLLRLHDDVSCDVTDFLDAVERDEFERAASLYTGPFLDGFYLSGAPQFEVWVEETRARLHFAALKVLETLARRAVHAGDPRAAVRQWRRLTALDPYSALFATGLIQALAASNDPTAALGFALEYEARVRRELETEPDPAIGELIANIRANRLSVSVAIAQTLVKPVVAAEAQPLQPAAAGPSKRRRSWIPVGIAATLAASAVAWGMSTRTSSADTPFLAVGLVQVPDTVVRGAVLRDMLATNLARINGLQVVANSRLLELLPRGDDSLPGATADAARRAGANEMVEGELSLSAGALVLTMRRVALPSGIVRRGYTVRAADPYALTDSATAAIARDLNLDLPPDPVSNVRTSSAVAYALYEEGLRALYGGNPAAALRLMDAALARDSTFAMAAYFGWMSAGTVHRYEDVERLLPVVRRLAARTVDRERLWIETALARVGAPLAETLALAQEFARRFPDDPDAQIELGLALWAAGDWAGSAAAFERSVAIDSAAGATAATHCRVCTSLSWLAISYLWSDSLGAAERAARRLITFRPEEAAGWDALMETLLRNGHRAEAEAAAARARSLSVLKADRSAQLNRDLIRAGRSDELEASIVSALRNASDGGDGELPWLLAFSLRNQGRLREAERLAREGVVPGSASRLKGPPDVLSLSIIPLERGQPFESARRFLDVVAGDRGRSDPPGFKARQLAFHFTLAGTALAAAGDTAKVRALADSVERIGANSSFGRDLHLHFFLRGLLLQRQNRHADAVDAFRRALFSSTEGYTRVNLEMARSLMALRRFDEAIAILRPALRGGVDGSNTYVTHTELRFALAHAYEAAGERDSAAMQYALVERAWRRADAEFGERYREARAKATLAH